MTGGRFVIDASIVMSWCFEDENDGYAVSVLESLEENEALVPAVWPLEVGNVLVVAMRKKRLGEADVSRFTALLSNLPIKVEQETPGRMLGEILALAKEHNLPTYDASYLDLAMRMGLPLASNDGPLLQAAKNCKVQVFRS